MSLKIKIFLIAVLVANISLVACEAVDYPSSAELPGELLFADIVISETTKGWSWPWIASFYLENQFFCAGSIIRDDFVLSAAHCFHQKMNPNPINADGVMVWAGKHNLTSKEGLGRFLEKIMIHPDWDPMAESFDADIAVVKTQHGLGVNIFPNVQAIKINSLRSLPTIGQVVGWGRSEDSNIHDSSDHEKMLKQLSIKAVSNERCFVEFPDLAMLSSRRTFCAGWPGFEANTCSGDSGGGFYVRDKDEWNLVGIVSAGTQDGKGACIADKYNIFTKVADFSKWIDAMIKDDNALIEKIWHHKKDIDVNGEFYRLSLTAEMFTLKDFRASSIVWIKSVNSRYTKHNPYTNATTIFIIYQTSNYVPCGMKSVFPNLKNLVIYQSKLTKVKRQCLRDYTTLNFASNQIRKIPVDAFWLSPGLTDLDLSGNELTKLDENLFIYARKLQHFSANHNKIQILHENLFGGNPAIETISLIGNRLTVVQVELYTLKSLKIFALNNNTCIDAEINLKTQDKKSQFEVVKKIAENC